MQDLLAQIEMEKYHFTGVHSVTTMLLTPLTAKKTNQYINKLKKEENFTLGDIKMLRIIWHIFKPTQIHTHH